MNRQEAICFIRSMPMQVWVEWLVSKWDYISFITWWSLVGSSTIAGDGFLQMSRVRFFQCTAPTAVVKTLLYRSIGCRKAFVRTGVCICRMACSVSTRWAIDMAWLCMDGAAKLCDCCCCRADFMCCPPENVARFVSRAGFAETIESDADWSPLRCIAWLIICLNEVIGRLRSAKFGAFALRLFLNSPICLNTRLQRSRGPFSSVDVIVASAKRFNPFGCGWLFSSNVARASIIFSSGSGWASSSIRSRISGRRPDMRSLIASLTWIVQDLLRRDEGRMLIAEIVVNSGHDIEWCCQYCRHSS